MGRPGPIVLYDYWRSSASYRVRIALNLLGWEYETRAVNLLSAAHKSDDYLVLNPQGLVPTLLIDQRALTQSLAIIEYLHARSDGSTLLPPDIAGQHRVRQLSYALAMDVHPVCNLNVAQHVASLVGDGDAARVAWMRHFIGKGLDAFEALLADADAGPFCHGDTPSMADCCLIPQLYNADRWGVDYAHHPRIVAAGDAARALDAFAAAHPDTVGPPSDAR